MSSFSTLPILLSILILAFIISPTFGSNPHPCSDDFYELTTQKHITNCKRLRTLGAELGWNYQNNNTYNSTLVEILFGAPLERQPGWIAWGVNPGERAEMIGTKAIVGIIFSDRTLKANKFNITPETRTGCRLIPAPNIGFQVLNMTVEHNAESDFYTIYARLLLPHEAYNISKLNHVWQVGYVIEDDVPRSHPTSLHNVDSTETIDLIDNGQSVGQSKRSFLRSVHGVLNIIGWGTFLPLGIIVARYMRVFPIQWDNWFLAHKIFQSIGFLTGTAGFAIGLYLGHASRYYTFHTHRTFGIIIFTFSTVQMFAFRLRPRETDEYRKYWNMYHHFLGYGLLAIIVINIFKGIGILKGGIGWKWAYIGILALLGAITFGFEIFTWLKFFWPKLKKKITEQQRNSQQQSADEKGSKPNK